MNLTSNEKPSLLKHPVEAALAILLLISLLFIAPDRQTTTKTAEACSVSQCSSVP